MTTDFIPRPDAELLVWLNNFITKVPSYGTTLGLTPAQVTELTDACNNTIASINAVEIQKAQLKQTTAAKEDSIKAAVSLVRNSAGIMKRSAAYTQGMGDDMGINGAKVNPDLPNMKPALTLAVFPGHVTIDFTKKGFTGVNIYSRAEGTVSWTFLARDTVSPYIDNRPLASPNVAETREYMAMGLDVDEEVGQPSDIVSVLFGG